MTRAQFVRETAVAVFLALRPGHPALRAEDAIGHAEALADRLGLTDTADAAPEPPPTLAIVAAAHRARLNAEERATRAELERDAAQALAAEAAAEEREACAWLLENDARLSPGIGKHAAALIRARGTR